MSDDFQFWIGRLGGADEAEVLAGIDMLKLLMDEAAIPHLLTIIVEGSQSRVVQQATAEAVAQIAGEAGQSLVRQQAAHLETDEQRRLFQVALSGSAD